MLQRNGYRLAITTILICSSCLSTAKVSCEISTSSNTALSSKIIRWPLLSLHTLTLNRLFAYYRCLEKLLPYPPKSVCLVKCRHSLGDISPGKRLLYCLRCRHGPSLQTNHAPNRGLSWWKCGDASTSHKYKLGRSFSSSFYDQLSEDAFQWKDDQLEICSICVWQWLSVKNERVICFWLKTEIKPPIYSNDQCFDWFLIYFLKLKSF